MQYSICERKHSIASASNKLNVVRISYSYHLWLWRGNTFTRVCPCTSLSVLHGL